MLTYVDWTPGRWGRVRTELLRPCGLPVLYLTARDVPARRVLRTLRRLRRAGDVRCAILPDALTPRAALCGIADPDEAALRRALLTPLLRALTGAEDGVRIPAVLLSAAYAPTLGPLPPDGRLLCALFQAGKLPIAAIGVKSVQHNA